MRGKPMAKNHWFGESGNIPAYAGKTEWGASGLAPPAEHPRVCGENGTVTKTPGQTAGTSPRMRGKLFCVHGRVEFCRNIPAYAGKTCSHPANTGTLWEHPRVCGENRMFMTLGLLGGGTSPRMRGKRQEGTGHSMVAGNIPAYAGKTHGRISQAVTEAEHPRVCGENHSASGMSPRALGTSPRMRGKRIHCL